MPDPVQQPPDIASKLQRFAELVRASDHNLVSKRARDELEVRHVPECVAFASMLPSGRGRVLDIGSGGGFPGMIVAICRPELEVHLLDATAKKTGFLREAAAELGVAVTVHTGRAEELARQDGLAASFDVVTARAVAPLDRLIGWSMPFLRVGGLLYAIKGERWSAELQASRPSMSRAGAAVVATPDDVGQEGGGAPGDGGADHLPRVVMLTRVR
jgi:16S rRNA (guanine527-N7)-methyltransferase